MSSGNSSIEEKISPKLVAKKSSKKKTKQSSSGVKSIYKRKSEGADRESVGKLSKKSTKNVQVSENKEQSKSFQKSSKKTLSHKKSANKEREDTSGDSTGDSLQNQPDHRAKERLRESGTSERGNSIAYPVEEKVSPPDNQIRPNVKSGGVSAKNTAQMLTGELSAAQNNVVPPPVTKPAKKQYKTLNVDAIMVRKERSTQV